MTFRLRNAWRILTGSSSVRFGIFVGYVIPKPSLKQNGLNTIQHIAGGNKSMCPKVNVTAPVEFELAYFEAAVLYFSTYITEFFRYLQTSRNFSCLKNDVIQYNFIKTLPQSFYQRYILNKYWPFFYNLREII